jgi:hypothetical protein
MSASVRERIISKTRTAPGSDCWEWSAGRFNTGYGAFSNGGKTLKAHRASYAEFVGPIPPGMLVCHRCDNPGCVNPDHLFLGTAADNMSDKASKGRSMRGEKNHTTKLDEANVKLIKGFLQRHPPVKGQHGGPCTFLARWFGVTQTAISFIHAKKNWAWVS